MTPHFEINFKSTLLSLPSTGCRPHKTAIHDDLVCWAGLQAYKTAFTAALEAEFAEEWQLADERLSSWSTQRLQVPI